MKKSFILLLIVTLTQYSYSQSIDDAVDLGLSVKWASHNIGAKSPNEYGTYYSWGEIIEKKSFTYESYKYTDTTVDYQSTIDIGANISGTEYDVAKVKWKGDWRLPTDKEVLEMRKECRWRWTNIEGVYGYIVTGPNGNQIFLPAGGEMWGENVRELNETCYYWTGTQSTFMDRNAFTLHAFIHDGQIGMNCWAISKPSGVLVRPVMTNEEYKPVRRVDTSNPQVMEWQDPKYEDVLQGVFEEDYEKTFNSLTILSAQGDVKALCALATMYCFPAGTTRDYSTAYNLLKEATLQNYERAEYLLGAFGSLARARKNEVYQLLTGENDKSIVDGYFWKQCFKSSEDVETFKDAFEWFYMKDGHWGYRDIMYYAAIIFLDESSELYNKEKGLKWLRRSAELDYYEAESLLKKYE